MPRRQRYAILAGLAIVLLLGAGGYWRSLRVLHPRTWGSTMGTGYSITISGRVHESELKELSSRVDQALLSVNRQMSTWDPGSEISLFNASTSLAPVKVSADFCEVVRRALRLAASSDGAFDPTLQPLLNLWGFGSGGTNRHVPDDEAVAAALSRTGWNLLTETGNGSLQKSRPDLQLALGGIAKGYGVDQLADILRSCGFENWFVEVGGEVAVSGTNPDNEPWRIGIQYPSINPMDERLQGVLHMTNGAAATSGDYRNYIRRDGIIYSHILDPRSGRTVLSKTAGVTVIAETCMEADGMATALFVMGPESGMTWVETLPKVECMFLLRDDDGKIIEKFSSGFIAASGYIHNENL